MLKPTAFIIHGTEGYPEENWFPWLKNKLEQNGYQVIVPHFPSPPIIPAKLDEWLTVWGKNAHLIDRETMIIGHSLGGLFALHILENLKNPIRAAAFVGTPIGLRPILNYDRDAAFCGFDFDWKKISHHSRRKIIFHSDNDPYVSLGNGKLLAEKLGTSLSFVSNAGHFNSAAGYDSFPQLWTELQKTL